MRKIWGLITTLIIMSSSCNCASAPDTVVSTSPTEETAIATPNYWMTGSAFLRLCEAAPDAGMLYIAGVDDSFSLLASKMQRPLYCAPANTPMGVYLKVYLSFIKRHPGAVELAAVQGIVTSFVEAWPCGSAGSVEQGQKEDQNDRSPRLAPSTNGSKVYSISL